MRLANLNEFRRMVFTLESAPSVRTLRAQIDGGKIPGGMIQGGRYYVDLDAYDTATQLRAGLLARQRELSGNPLLQGLL